jgi:8-oxo-dGTP pyrophosphatase MutT (NUDIX family)
VRAYGVWGDQFFIMSDAVLAHSLDTYGGANVDAALLPQSPAEFDSRLQLSIHAWGQQGVKGVWLKLPIHLSEFVPVAVKHGFEYHSASRHCAVLCRWLPPSTSLLPNGPVAQVGVGAYILSTDNKILLVTEACGPAAAAGMWKVPTGLVERGEDVEAAVVREVREETGLDVSFVGVLGLLHRQAVRSAGCADIDSLVQGWHCGGRIRRHVHHVRLHHRFVIPRCTIGPAGRRAFRFSPNVIAAIYS